MRYTRRSIQEYLSIVDRLVFLEYYTGYTLSNPEPRLLWPPFPWFTLAVSTRVSVAKSRVTTASVTQKETPLGGFIVGVKNTRQNLGYPIERR
jgi:hypothetical protein